MGPLKEVMYDVISDNNFKVHIIEAPNIIIVSSSDDIFMALADDFRES